MEKENSKQSLTHGCHLDHDVSIREVVGPHAVQRLLEPLHALRGAPLQLEHDGDVEFCQLEAPDQRCLLLLLFGGFFRGKKQKQKQRRTTGKVLGGSPRRRCSYVAGRIVP